MRILLNLIGILLLSVYAMAQPSARAVLVGEVVGVSDGDTVRVLDAGKVVHRVRLLGIDAPESSQAWGQRSKQHLASLVFRHQVRVLVVGTDRYGREIGKIEVDGKDANLEQVKAGLAWWYEHFSQNQPAGDAERYASAERSARAARLGLWSDPTPMAPWDYRRLNK